MIGALIGDLAAWTYENDKDTFFAQLIPDKNKLPAPSIYADALMKASSKYVLNCPNINDGLQGTYKDGIRYFGQWLTRQLLPAWDFEISEVVNIFDLDNGEFFAQRFVIELIRQLRHGATKSEAYHSIDVFVNMSKSIDWRQEFNIKYQLDVCAVVLRAWNAFYLGFDFTSTIHNAVKWKEERHLVTMLAAAFADAMYGCEQSFIKSKFAKNGEISSTIIPLHYGERNGYHHGLIHELAAVSFEHRSFFPKNCALTNVEWHNWQYWGFDTDDMLFSEDQYQKIMRAGRTGWENRFGIYLDNGWFYCYRSHWLLLRFKLKKESSSNSYKMEKLQLSREKDFCSSVGGLCNALLETCQVPVPAPLDKCLKVLDYCLFFKGETDYPQTLSSGDRVFWQMEHEYYTQRYLRTEQRKMWEKEALAICIKDEKLADFMKNDKIPLCVKGMIDFCIADIYYHSPMGGCDIVYKYAERVALKFANS